MIKNRSYALLKFLLPLIALSGYLQQGFAEVQPAFNSLDIEKATLAAATNPNSNCLNYRIKGVCYWSNGYYITQTFYIDQFLPDVVVSVFNEPGDNKWSEANLIDQAGKEAEKAIVNGASGGDVAAGGDTGTGDSTDRDQHFKEVDVFGNPAVLTFSGVLGMMMLHSAAMPMVPYYQSMADAFGWRGFPPQGVAEGYAALPFVKNFVGTVSDNWGSVLPYQGDINQADETKAAAVLAQRGVNFSTTSPASPFKAAHFNFATLQSGEDACGDHCNADPYKEDDLKSTRFQLIYPVAQNTCDVIDKTVVPTETYASQTEKGAYAWIVWRHYEGCVQGVGKYIGSVHS